MADAGSRGLTMTSLLNSYNRDVIVASRLKRLMDAGEVVCEHGRYRLVNRWSLLIVRERIAAGIKRLFP
jgi:hypothetical protein